MELKGVIWRRFVGLALIHFFLRLIVTAAAVTKMLIVIKSNLQAGLFSFTSGSQRVF